MSDWYYAYAGLRIASQLSIPEWAVFEQPAAFTDPDVRILVEAAASAENAAASETAAASGSRPPACRGPTTRPSRP